MTHTPRPKMHISIYNEPPGGSIGGSECLSAVLAEELGRRHAVTLLHHRRDLDPRALEHYFGLDLSNARLQFEERQPMRTPASRLALLTRGDAREWRAQLSAPYDVFIAICHSIPPFCHATHGVLVVLFPLYKREVEWPWNDPPRHKGDLWRAARRHYYEHEWRKRLASYTHVVSISEFTRGWTNRLWGVDSTVVYPPVLASATAGIKANAIISVGRFTPAGHAKRHPEMLEAFAGLPELRQSGWSFECLGSLGTTDADRAYFDQVNGLAQCSGAVLCPNASRAELEDAYGRAKIFVHAAGFGTPDDRPELTEHFGIATVEAMAAGCVPLVINKGAQPEIVEHGSSGFLWNTVAELQDYVRLLAGDDALRKRMSAAAIRRSGMFTREAFVEGMLRVLPLEPSDARLSESERTYLHAGVRL